MKILLTGGAGFIGSHTAELLSKRGHQVLVVDNFSTGRSENLAKFKGKIQVADITELACLDPIFYEFQPEAVLHLAAQSAITVSQNDPQKDLTVNGIGTLNLIQMSVKYGVKRFVFSSTSAVYCEEFHEPLRESHPCLPRSPYGISKLTAEHYIRTMFPNHLILRYANVYGPRQVAIGENQVVARIFNHLFNGAEFKIIGHGHQKRDYIYVDDIAYANFTALMCDTVGTFNACTGKSASVNEVCSVIANLCNLGAYWERTKENDPRGDVLMDNRAIRCELGWSASIPLRDGLQKTWEWWREKK